jgi:Na+/H+ antiporter NhaD/arsenite permease-like protein
MRRLTLIPRLLTWLLLLLSLLLPALPCRAAASTPIDGMEVTIPAGGKTEIKHTFDRPVSKLRVSIIENGTPLSEGDARHGFKTYQEPGKNTSFYLENLGTKDRSVKVAVTPHASIKPAGMPWSVLMLVLLFTAFVCMTKFGVPIPLAMSLLACAFLGIMWDQADVIAHNGFHNFAEIALVFTAVAIPAHMIERSRGFEWMAAILGHQFGRVRLKSPRAALPLLVTVLLGVTYVLAGLMHNITSILIVTPIIIRLCDSYAVPSRWILCAALVASNLGGFSTRWGDTPNIVEAREWGLKAGDFMREILPPNLIVLTVLIIVACVLTRKELLRAALAGPSAGGASSMGSMKPGMTLITAMGAAGWDDEKGNIAVDRRLFNTGMIALVAFITLHVVFHELSMTLGGLTILACVLMDRPRDREHTLKSLGFDVYITFGAIFIIAGCIKNSWIGETLQQQIQSLGYAPWAITLTGYFGTTFTEAGSWVSAVAEEIAAGSPTHASAWALGAGICAGSSSILTSASAGIILWEQSARYKEHAITFKNYLFFGLGFSLFMLVFYSLYFTFLFRS